MKKLLIIFLLFPTLAMSGIFKDDEGKFSLKTSSKSGFKHHTNHMGHNDYNFKYIKDKNDVIPEAQQSNSSIPNWLIILILIIFILILMLV